MAPEVFKRSYDQRCDVWSVGVIMFLLITGEYPFKFSEGCDFEKEYKESRFNTQLRSLELVSDEAKNFLRKLFEFDYK